MSGLAVPYDPEAEREVAGAAVSHRDGFARLSRWCVPGDFYAPMLGKVFAAAPAAWALTPPPPAPPAEVRSDVGAFLVAVENDPDLLTRVQDWNAARERERQTRLEFLAAAARTDVETVASIAQDGAVDETLARRVAELARSRAVMTEAAAVYNALGGGRAVAEVTASLRRLVELAQVA